MRKNIILATISFFLLAGVILYYSNIVSQIRENQWSFVNLLRTTAHINSQLNESILKSSLLNRDDFETMVIRSALLKKEREEILLNSQERDAEMVEKINNLSHQIDIKLKDIEEFNLKSKVLRGAVLEFKKNADELPKLANQLKQSDLKLKIAQIVWIASDVLSNQNEEKLMLLKSHLDSLSQKNIPLSISSRVAEMKSQLDIIEKTKGLKDRVMEYSSFDMVALLLSEIEHLQQKEFISQNYVNYQRAVFIISLILCSLIFYILYQLWQSIESLKEANSTLEERVILRTKDLAESNSVIKSQQELITYTSKMSALGEMAAGIAHEINNPLAIIMLTCKNLQKNLTDKEKLTDGLKNLELTTTRIAKIVKGLKTFSQTSPPDQFVKASFLQILDETLAICQERLKEKDIEVILSPLEGADQEIECNPTLISQVILNLLNNACDAIECCEDRWIRIEHEKDHDRLKIKVTDSGQRIPDEVVEKIMQPFFTTKEVGKGTGLGLSTSRGIIESHNGSLYLERGCENTCFVIILPLKNGPIGQLNHSSHSR